MATTRLSPNDINTVTKGQQKEIFAAHTQGAKVRRRGEQDMEYAAANIAQEYRRRIEATKVTANLVAERRGALLAEQKAIEASRASVVKMLSALQRPLALTLAWNDTQQGSRKTASRQGPRATQEGGTDSVRNALKQTEANVKRNISRLAELLLDVDMCAKELRATRERYDQDITDSHTAVRADVACLHNRRPPGTDEAKALAAGGASLSLGTVAVERSKATRTRVAEALKGMQQAGITKKPAAVVDALNARVDDRQQQCTNLVTNVKMLRGELQMIERNAAAASQTMARVQAQIRETQTRIAMNPEREKAGTPRTAAIERRSVEQTLDVELMNLKRSEEALSKQLADFAAKKKRVRGLVANIEREALDRVSALRTDRECQVMELPPIGCATPRGQ